MWFALSSDSYASSAAKVYFAKNEAVYVIWDSANSNQCIVVNNNSVTSSNSKTEGECVNSVTYPVFELFPSQKQNTFLAAVVLLTWTDFVSFILFCLVLFSFVQMLPS